MATSEVINIKKARKNHTCLWCWYDPIAKGQSYVKWFCFESLATVKMHPECYEAQLHWSEKYLPIPGTYRRGCHCDEDELHCECVPSPV